MKKPKEQKILICPKCKNITFKSILDSDDDTVLVYICYQCDFPISIDEAKKYLKKKIDTK